MGSETSMDDLTQRIRDLENENSRLRRLMEGLGSSGDPWQMTFNAMGEAVCLLDLFRDGPEDFDLVITDMTMPRMTGDRLTVEIMKIRPGMPVILCTGHSSLISEQKAEEIGTRAFIRKPLVMRDLAGTVKKVLNG